MWAARLLLLFVGVAAFHLHETTPEPTFLDVDEATSIILPADPSKARAVLLEAARRRLEHKETRAEMLKMLEGELHNELFRLSYADVKQFIPKQIIDFFESLSMNDTQHLQMALTVSEQAAAKVLQEHPESNASQVFEAALKAGLDHLRYNDDELWREVMELYELFNARIGRLKPQNFKRVGLWIEGWFAAMKEADGRATESDLEILKAAREEEIPYNVHQVIRSTWHHGINYLKRVDPKLAEKVLSLSEHFLKLKPESVKRAGLWIEGWLVAIREADSRATEEDLQILKAAREEFTERPLFNENAIADWVEQVPKLEAFFKSDLYRLARTYYFVYRSRHPLFHYEN